MERESLLKWIATADVVFKRNNSLTLCPIDETHFLTIKLEPFPKSKKLELTLECKCCKIKRTFTKEMEH